VIVSGVPFGAQTAWLSNSRTGWPLLVTRVAPVIHCAVTQGVVTPPGAKGHAATAYGAVIRTEGCPPTSTRGFGAVGWA
jgi:hypothetical protein